jgi:hypothetical protein
MEFNPETGELFINDVYMGLIKRMVARGTNENGIYNTDEVFEFLLANE